MLVVYNDGVSKEFKQGVKANEFIEEQKVPAQWSEPAANTIGVMIGAAFVEVVLCKIVTYL